MHTLNQISSRAKDKLSDKNVKAFVADPSAYLKNLNREKGKDGGEIKQPKLSDGGGMISRDPRSSGATQK